VKRKVPDLGIGHGLVPGRNAGDRHVEDRQLGHAVAELRRRRVGDHGADVVADDRVAREAVRGHERVHVLGQIRLVVAGHGLVGEARAAEIRHDHRADTRQRGDDIVPLVPRLRPAMQQQDRGPTLATR